MATDPLHDHPPYTPAFCEAGYDNLARIPDHPAIFARWRDDAALARRTQSAQLGLAYGDDAAQTLDFFPARRPGAPLLTFIHGGYWRALGKADFSWLAPAFVARGAAVAILDYGLAPDTPIEDIVRQMLRAHAWLYRHADALGIDPARIVASGHSAGGHLAAMLSAAQWSTWSAALPARLLRAGVSVSGLYDLSPLAHAPFLANLGLDDTRAARLSPARFPERHATPLVTAVGEHETDEFKRQDALIARCWPRRVQRSLVLAGAHHLAACDALADPASPLFDATLGLLAA